MKTKAGNVDIKSLAQLLSGLEKLWDEVFSIKNNNFPPVVPIDYTVNNVVNVSGMKITEREYIDNVYKLNSLSAIGASNIGASKLSKNIRALKGRDTKDAEYVDLELFIARCFSICDYKFSDFSIAHQLEILYLYSFPFLFSTSGEDGIDLNGKEKELESVLTKERNKHLNYLMFLKLVSECPNPNDFVSMVKMLNRKDRILLDFTGNAGNCERDLKRFNEKVNMQDVAFGMCDFDLLVNTCLVNNNYSQKVTRTGNEVVVNTKFIESLLSSL